ncbi:MAG: TetR/AcrR family transcriptional regulator [Patulibacter sp.]|nr:TetR/AcrR family transcriptional regulator [Patulibacter sp.]
MLSITSASGYGALSVSEIIRTSGVSRRGFNAWFAGPEDAFVAAHDQCMGQLVDAVRAAIDADGVPEHQLRRGLQAAIEYVVADPARADAVLLEVHAAGHRAQRSQEAAVQELVAEAHAVLVRFGLEEPVARRLAPLGIGAVREAIRTRMTRGELHTLPGVVGELADAAFPLRSLDPSDCRPGATSMPVLAA